MDKQELQKIVNPVYTTAKGTVMLLAGMGDKDAISLIPYIGTDEKGVKQEVPKEIQKCFMIAQRARYEMHNRAALASGSENIVDLPSGYAPRGFRVSSEGKHYYGFDLPVVSDTMKAATEKTMTDEQLALTKYCAVDATNYESMRKALDGVQGEICIVTEGMLGYFNEPEIVSFCRAIHRLLEEFGGSWITADMTSLAIYPLTFGTVLKGNQEIMTQLSKNIAANMADVEFYKNSLYLNGLDGALEFLRKQGFNVKRESIDVYLPDFADIDPQLMQELRQAYSTMEMLTMTLADGGDQADKDSLDELKELPFKVESHIDGGVLNVKIQGRMDTITAPELLEKFKKAEGNVDAIKIDVSDMPYVSSAGLRVLLIMYKSLNDKSKFELTGVRPQVKEIFETTGFDQFLL